VNNPDCRAYIFVCGIRSNPEDYREWAHRAEAWIETGDHGSGIAESFVYHTYALTRWIRQKQRAASLARLLATYAEECDLVVAAHSNGADLLLRVLRKTRIKLQAVHLFAAAADPDFRRNGLNDAIAEGRIGRLYLYGSLGDAALRVGSCVRRVLGWAGLGYGDLGRVGPQHMTALACLATRREWRNAWGHSTWFDEPNFEETMKAITR